MKILFDQGTPAPRKERLPGHEVDTAFERGWSTLQNGELLTRAEGAGYDLLITTDRNLKYQQNLEDRTLAILVLLSTSWPRIECRIDEIRTAIDSLLAGGYIEVAI